jgi:hypothetical protein
MYPRTRNIPTARISNDRTQFCSSPGDWSCIVRRTETSFLLDPVPVNPKCIRDIAEIGPWPRTWIRAEAVRIALRRERVEQTTAHENGSTSNFVFVTNFWIFMENLVRKHFFFHDPQIDLQFEGSTRIANKSSNSLSHQYLTTKRENAMSVGSRMRPHTQQARLSPTLVLKRLRNQF